MIALKIKIFVFTTITILIFLSVGGCISQDSITLDGVEIKEYQGEKLGSINDFRENSIKGPQYIEINNYTLEITGLVEKQINFSYYELIKNFQHYKKVVTLYCVEGWRVKILWKGILVKDIIDIAKPISDSKVVIFHAFDGYTTSLPLGYIIDNNILIAFEMNNLTIPTERGFPFQLIAESKWGYKWIKWITEIEISDNEQYKGYWERRGYSNTADLNNSFIG